MASADSTTLAAFIKTRFPQRKIESLVEFGSPLLASMAKEDSLDGDGTIVPLEVDQPQGISAALQTAIGSETASKGLKWTITGATGYASVSVDGLTMLKMRRDEGSFFRARERQVKGILAQLGQQYEMMLFGDGAGKLGQLSADPGTGTTWTLASAADAINFHVGMRFEAYANSSGALGTLRTGGPYTVASVNYGTGVITTGTINAAVGSDDFLVRYGNNDAAMKGLAAWIPSADPTSSFFGVTRSDYSPQMVGGHRVSWQGSIENTVKNLEANMRRLNSEPRVLWLSFASFNRLEVELGAKGYRKEDGGQKTFGSSSLMMSTPGGGIEVRCSPYCPDTGGWLLDMSSWSLRHLGGLPHVIDDDGSMATRIGSTASDAVDAIRIWFRWHAQPVCTNPFANGYLAIS